MIFASAEVPETFIALHKRILEPTGSLVNIRLLDSQWVLDACRFRSNRRSLDLFGLVGKFEHAMSGELNQAGYESSPACLG